MAVLSISSHVSFGGVGNAASVFALQRLGCGVWPIHTTLLNNHSGHSRPRGVKFGPDTVRWLILGLAEFGVLEQCEAVFSGYLGDAGTAGVVATALVHAVSATYAILDAAVSGGASVLAIVRFQSEIVEPTPKFADQSV